MISQSHHFRVRGDNKDLKTYGFEVENYIKSIEKQFKMDIRKLPRWKEVVKRLYVATEDWKRKKLASEVRKKCIIDTIYMQATRFPIPVCDNKTRASKKMQAIKTNITKQTVSILPDAAIENVQEYEEMPGKLDVPAHHNTEIMTTVSVIASKPSTEQRAQTDVDLGSEHQPHLPTYLRVNQHKLVSPLGTQDSGWSYASRIDELEYKSESDFKEWLTLKQSSKVQCTPSEIKINYNILEQQRIKFSILNCSTEYLNLRYKCVTDKTRFKWAKICPETPQRLYPGLQISLTFIFKLLPNIDNKEFVSSLYFKVGYNTIAELPLEACVVPIVSCFSPKLCYTVSETVVFPPAYSYHINGYCGYPSGVVKISVKDGNHYIIRVQKREVNYTASSTISGSDEAIAPNTTSIIKRGIPNEPEFLSPDFSIVGDLSQIVEEESVQTIDIISLIVSEIVELSLEAFMFEHTYIDLHSDSQKIQVYFTKTEHIGCHQCHYDFQLCEPETGHVVETKTVLLLAEVLPHPIQLTPEFLEMTNSPIIHGICEDRIFITNTHKVYNVVVKFKLTTKMRKLFRIFPMETLIEPLGKTFFTVQMCSRESKYSNKPDDFAHFTVKIIFMGDKSIYHNVPPHFYEIIAPCAFDFKKVYNQNYWCQ